MLCSSNLFMGRAGFLIVGGHVKRAVPVFLLSLFILVASSTFAQSSGDIAFGFSALTTPGASSAAINSGNFYAPGMGGGLYLSFSGDIAFWHNLGVQGEVAWRASQGTYLGYQPYRPVFYDFGAIYTKRYGRIAPELTAGLGASSTRFYTNYYNCNFISGCTNYNSSTHFMLAFGGGIKLYPFHNFFVRPEVRYYWIHNNFEFASDNALRIGAAIGYSFGGK